MSHPFISVVGEGNIAGHSLQNVGNTYITNVTRSERDKGRTLTLESCVAFDALLNAKERYPAPRCHADTRVAAQGVVTNWVCRKGEWADRGIMWMSGAPGVGKSAILQTVCEVLGADDGSKSWLTKFGFSDNDVDGSHFFGRGLGDREKASFFPATIAYQLSRSRTTFRDSINQTIANDPSILVAAFPSQFQQLVIKPVQELWWFQAPATIVIDALDECADIEDQVKLLNLILEAVTSTRIRFLISSRPEQQIQTFFQRTDVSQHTYHIRLDEESFNTSRDIEVFLRGEFARIRREKPGLCLSLPNGEDWPGNVIITRIRDDSDSQFIFPTLVISYIDTPFYAPDQQLRILLEAPPPRAFSKLDALYERILSRSPPELLEGSDELTAYQRLVLDILAAVVAWPEPIAIITIAGVLKGKVDVVQSVIMGPMRSLFKLDPSKPTSAITLCHKSLRDYLLNIERSHKFFVPAADPDTLFFSILARRPPRDRSYSQDQLRRVLAVLVFFPAGLTVCQIAEALGVDLRLVQNVVWGPAGALFGVGTDDNITFSSSSLRVFLQDSTRSGELFIRDEESDAIFIQILSRPSPSDSYCRDDLLDALTAVMVQGGGAITEGGIMHSLLGVHSWITQRVAHGHARSLFHTSEDVIQFSTSLLAPFLRDASRSGEFHIRGRDNHDVILIRILSRQPPSDPSKSYSREVLMGVLTLVTWPRQISVSEIASALAVERNVVEAVVGGPVTALFKVIGDRGIKFSVASFKAFLQDADRAGEYFIPSEELDAIFFRILSRPPPSENGYYDTLKDVLVVLVVWPRWLTIAQIGSAIADGSQSRAARVQDVVFGPARLLFCISSNGAVGLYPRLKGFLQNSALAGEFYVPPRRLNPKWDVLYKRIHKIRR